MANQLDWLDDIEWEDLLTGDTRLIYDAAGAETLRRMWAQLAGINLYISGKPLDEARRRYIRQYYDGTNVKALAARLGCSTRFVHGVLADRAKGSDKPGKGDSQGRLF